MPGALPYPPHYSITNGRRWIFDRSTLRTVSAPWPLAWATCVKTEAEACAEKLNSLQHETFTPWQVIEIDIAGIAATETALGANYLAHVEAA